MTQDALFNKYKTWAKKSMWVPYRSDLDNAVMILSYSLNGSARTRTGVSVRAIGAHTDKLHLFIFSVKTTWEKDENNEDDGRELDVRYKLILSF